MSFLQEPEHIPSYDPCWEGLRRGDKAALKALYEQYANLLYNYGRHIMKDKDLVRDCIQDLFVELWQNHQQLGPTTSVRFYLYKSLRRKILYESKKLERQLSSGPYTEEEVDVVYHEGTTESEALFASKRKIELQKLVDTLPGRQKEALTLVFFENLTRSEAAEVMGVDTATIYSLICRAISTLKKDRHLVTSLYFLSFSIPFLIAYFLTGRFFF